MVIALLAQYHTKMPEYCVGNNNSRVVVRHYTREGGAIIKCD